MLNVERDDVQDFLVDYDLYELSVDNMGNLSPCMDCTNCIFNNHDYASCRVQQVWWLAQEVKGECTNA